VLDLIEPGSNLLITFDCDGLDPSIMPGVIGRVRGGLTYWQAVDLLRGAKILTKRISLRKGRASTIDHPPAQQHGRPRPAARADQQRATSDPRVMTSRAHEQVG